MSSDNEVSQRGPMTGKYIFVVLPCKSDAKQKIAKTPQINSILVGGTTPSAPPPPPPPPPFSAPCHFFFLKSDFWFKIKFVILSTSSTVLDDGVSYCFSCPPPPTDCVVEKFGQQAYTEHMAHKSGTNAIKSVETKRRSCRPL